MKTEKIDICIAEGEIRFILTWKDNVQQDLQDCLGSITGLSVT